MKNYILLILVFVTLWSCNKTLNFDDEGYANQLVLNSIINPDSTFFASIVKSTSILTYNQLAQGADGSLDVYEDGIFLTHLTSSKGIFRVAGIRPKAGSAYRIVGTSNGQQIESETNIPLPAEVMSVDTMSGINDYGSKVTHYKIKIKDTGGDDYYRIVIMNENLSQVIDQDNNGNNNTRKYYINNIQCSIHSGDPVFKSVYNNLGDDILDMGPENDYYIFPDDYFKGKEYSIQLNATSNNYYYNGYNYSGYGNTKVIYDRFTVHVQRLSKDLYNYMKYLKLYNNYHENPFAEPVPVYSNVKNGVGIFAGLNDDVKFTYEKIHIPFSMDTITVEKNSYNGYGGGYQYH